MYISKTGVFQEVIDVLGNIFHEGGLEMFNIHGDRKFYIKNEFTIIAIRLYCSLIALI